MEYFPCGHRLLIKPVEIEQVDEAFQQFGPSRTMVP